MRAHALLSASASHRWLACPPSAKLEATFPESHSVYADEGTRAHALAEDTLRRFLYNGNSEVRSDDAEMQESIQYYVDACIEKINAARKASRDALALVEHRLDFSAYVPQGFGTGDMIIISDDGLEIVDLKYGKGVRVDADHNSQMMLYALGALEEYGYLYDCAHVRMTIIQPRIDNISSFTISDTELLAWGDKVREIAKVAYVGGGSFQAGDHCRFCKAKNTCRAYRGYMMAVVGDDFIPGPQLTDYEISEILERSKQIKNWLDGIEVFALSQALEGKQWPGMKLVAGRSTRKLIDEKVAAETLSRNGYGDEIYKPVALKSITDLEKICGKKRFAELMASNLEKPAGKPTLVAESDRRPALQVHSVNDDFDDSLL